MKTGKNRIVTRFFEGAALSGACGKGCGFPPAGPGQRGNFSKRWRTSGVFRENPVEKYQWSPAEFSTVRISGYVKNPGRTGGLWKTPGSVPVSGEAISCPGYFSQCLPPFP